MADQVMQQRPRKPAYPVGGVSEHCLSVGWVVMRVALDALQVDRRAAEEAFPDESAHPQRLRAELEVMADCDPAARRACQIKKPLCLSRVHGERLFHVDMAPGLQAQPPQL